MAVPFSCKVHVVARLSALFLQDSTENRKLCSKFFDMSHVDVKSARVQSSNERGKQTTEFVKRFVGAREVRITIVFL